MASAVLKNQTEGSYTDLSFFQKKYIMLYLTAEEESYLLSIVVEDLKKNDKKQWDYNKDVRNRIIKKITLRTKTRVRKLLQRPIEVIID